MDIRENPFYILEVSTQDSKRKIMEAAEEKMLFLDADVVESAKSALLDSNKRLDAELAWFSSIMPEDNSLIIEAINNDFESSNVTSLIDGYDEINLQLEILKRRSFGNLKNKKSFGMSILSLSKIFDEYTTDSDSFSALCWILNNDRDEAGFPAIDDEKLLNHLDRRRVDIVADIKTIMNDLPTDCLIASMTYLAEEDTERATKRASLLIESLFDSYEIEIQPFISKHGDKICSFVNRVLDENTNNLTKNLPSLTRMLLNHYKTWHSVLKPMQIITLSKGEEHRESIQILNSLRDVIIRVNNDLGKPEISIGVLHALDSMLAFEYMPSFRSVVLRDVSTLNEIIRENKEYERRQQEEEREYNEWVKSIQYETELGLIFKDMFKISVDGIEWKGCVTPLNAVTGLSWGAIRKSVNYIPTGTDYRISFQTVSGKIELSPNEQNFDEIISRLWKALAVPLITKMLKKLKNGETLYIGGISFTDKGVFLTKSGWFSSEKKFFLWGNNIQKNSNDGYLIISSGDYRASASYMNDMNTHLLEAMIRQFMANFNVKRPWLSCLLDSDEREISTSNLESSSEYKDLITRLQGSWYSEDGSTVTFDGNNLNGYHILAMKDMAGGRRYCGVTFVIDEASESRDIRVSVQLIPPPGNSTFSDGTKTPRIIIDKIYYRK